VTDEAMVRVLIVDDEAGLRRSLARILSARGFAVEMAEDGDRAIELLEANEPEVILCDLMMPKMGGFEVLEHTKRTHPHVEVVMMTAHADVDSAVAAVKSGAYDFLTKPFASNDAVALAVSKAADHKRLVERAARLEERLVAHERFGELVGTSSKMQAVYRLIEGVASATSTVLILGESGTGKELVARAIHQHSARADRPFVPVNCAAIPKELVESELFGHVRGAFTGAQSARTGLFEAGNSGTLFLDEVGDLPLAAQVKLLRALQDGEIKRVGSDETRFVDVRVLAATNVDLQQRIAEGTFRRDLYYRLNVIPIHVPPLREREDDIVLLTHHVLQKLARRMGRAPKRVSAEAMTALKSYAWPGNVRELEHAVEHAFVLAQGERIELGDLPQMAQQAPSSSREGRDTAIMDQPLAGLATLTALTGHLGQLGPTELAAPHVRFDLFALPYAEAKRQAMKAFDDGYVREVLSRSGGNLSAAARHAGLDRSNFRRIVKRRKTAE